MAEDDTRYGVEDEDEEQEDTALASRDEELSGKAGIAKALLKLYDDVEKGFDDQRDRADQMLDDWDIYNCKLGNKQVYSGNNQIFVPLVANAVDARKTRFVNQIFPQTGRYVDCLSSDETKPYALMALLEFYIRKSRLRTQVVPSLMVNGDVEGQYSVYVTWRKTKRHVVQKIHKEAVVDEESGVTDPDSEIEDIQESTITHGSPLVEVLSDADILVLPQTCDSTEEAISVGGSVSILRRWSKATIRKMMRDGDITKSAGGKLLREMNAEEGQGGARKIDKAKEMVDAAGIKRGARGKYALIYETWTNLFIDGEQRLCRAYFASRDNIAGCKRNPNWSDHLPLISCPVDKMQGAFKGMSKLKKVRDLQYYANDVMNEAADSSFYALLPIIMTDPEKNPRIGSMILSQAAIWETNPQDTQFAKFPDMWKDGLQIVATAKSEIFQSLSVNPATIPQSQTQKKQNQAEVAQNQQVDILTTADAVTIIEEGILTPLLHRMIELDHQHRDEEITIAQFGEMGRRASMEKIPPVQFDRHYYFKWLGVEAAREAAKVQQQIAGMNVIRGIPPEQLNGYRINLVPVIGQLVENTFGPRLAPLIFISPEEQMPVPVTEENMLLDEGYKVPVHAMDDDDAHIQAHMMAMKMSQQNGKKFLEHIWMHSQQKAKKQQAAQQMQAQQGGMPGIPGGAGLGVAGTPRPGAQPGQPRGGQNPPGAIHPDRMPLSMPRNM